jgi:molybdate transport system substrate-binding protein
MTLAAIALWLLAVTPSITDRHRIQPDELRIAVASNFSVAIAAIAERFEMETGVKVVVSPGSTGKHYAQIRNGAPFDLFLAADTLRPALLESDGLGVAGTRSTYTCGRLVVWSSVPDLVDAEGLILQEETYRFLAIANPRLAPYGRAAQEALQHLGLWDRLKPKMVRGENVSQAFQYVVSGNAELGFVSLSQIAGSNENIDGSYWEVPVEMYSPIIQQMILIKDSRSARRFMSFLARDEIRELIGAFGYQQTSPPDNSCRRP